MGRRARNVNVKPQCPYSVGWGVGGGARHTTLELKVAGSNPPGGHCNIRRFTRQRIFTVPKAGAGTCTASVAEVAEYGLRKTLISG